MRNLFFFLLLFSQVLGAQPYDSDLLSPAFHKSRRIALREALQAHSVAVIFSSTEKNRSNDVDYLYHQNPDYYYLCGSTEPEGILFIFKEDQLIKGKHVNELMLVQPRNPAAEKWTGRLLGPDGASKLSGVEMVLVLEDFIDTLISFDKFEKILLAQVPVFAKSKSQDPFQKVINKFKEETGFPGGHTDNILLYKLMANLRQTKSPEEIELMRKAISTSNQAINELMRSCKPGMKEYQAQAMVEFRFAYNGCEYPAYPSILGSGENSCILHYETNRKEMKSGELLVADVGGEYHGYSADVTRTIPVNGKFSSEQRKIYELVLHAQEEAIKLCQKGKNFYAPGGKAAEIIKKGLKDLGIIKNEDEYQKYFPHGTSHYLGLDVHDIGLYGDLKPGDVITVEPGIYIPENSPCDKKWWNIGVRIEDDVLITEQGFEILSAGSPKATADIEKLMSEKGFFEDLK